MAGSAKTAEATFPINLESNAGEVSADVASELEELRKKVLGAQDAVKNMGAALRSLRGTSDQVKAAKEELKQKIDAERNAISQANLALLKQGTTYEKLAANAKKLEQEKKKLDEQMKQKAIEQARANTDAMGNAVKLAGGPVQTLTDRANALGDVLGGLGGKMGAMTLVTAGVVAIVAAFTVAVVGAAAALVRFIVVAGDHERAQALMREGFSGSAANAKALGHQIDALAGKVPKSRDELNALSAELLRTRLTGPAVVDAMNAIGQASSAMGDQAGKTIQDLLTRGAYWNRFRLNPLDLEGTNVRFRDVAKELASQLHLTIDQAQQALLQGTVKADQGARAMRAVLERQFGQLNAKKLLTLDNQLQRFKDRLSTLAENVNVEPILNALDQLSKLFDTSTVTGKELQRMFTGLAQVIGTSLVQGVPLAVKAIKAFILIATEFATVFLTVKNALSSVFSSWALSGFVTARDIMIGARVAAWGLVAVLAIAIAPMVLLAAAIYGVAKALGWLWTAVTGAWGALKAINWGELGSSIIDGIVKGIVNGAHAVVSAIGSVADQAKEAFKNLLGIHSPSRLFQGYGFNLPEGAARGVRQGTPRFTAAVRELGEPAVDVAGGYGAPPSYAPPPAAAPAPPASVAGGGLVIQLGGVNITVEAGAKADPSELARAVTGPSFKALLTKAIEDALATAAIPTQAVTT